MVLDRTLAMDIDATPYRLFVMVADELSFTRAAKRLNISQPALSAGVREMERRLGFALFSRSSRRVELTPEGRLFLGNARRMVSEATWAAQAAREIRDNDLRIAAPLYTLYVRERRELIDRLITQNPDITLRIFDRTHSRTYSDLLRHEVDLALLIEPSDTATAEADAVAETDWPEGLERLSLGERRIGLQVPCDHHWAQHERIPVTMLKGQKIALPNRALGAPLSVTINRAMRDAGAEVVRPPDGHPIAVEHFGSMTQIPAISLRWFDTPPGGIQYQSVIREIDGLSLGTSLSLIRIHGGQRPAADDVWAIAQHQRDQSIARMAAPATKRKTARARTRSGRL